MKIPRAAFALYKFIVSLGAPRFLHICLDFVKIVLSLRDVLAVFKSQHTPQHVFRASLFLSRSRLSTRFKAETGKNLSDYIAEERIEEAKRLLVYTDKSLSAISAYLCFSSLSHFSRTFKKFTGRTPADYRENTPK